MDIDSFFHITEKASKFISESNICNSVFHVDTIIKKHNIIVDTIQNFMNITKSNTNSISNEIMLIMSYGITIKYGDKNIVLYDKLNYNELTILKQISYILLGYENITVKEEQEADIFISQLYVPIYNTIMLCNIIGFIDIELIETIFNVNSDIANIRMDCFNNIDTKNYIPSKYDLDLWENSKEYINNKIEEYRSK